MKPFRFLKVWYNKVMGKMRSLDNFLIDDFEILIHEEMADVIREFRLRGIECNCPSCMSTRHEIALERFNNKVRLN